MSWGLRELFVRQGELHNELAEIARAIAAGMQGDKARSPNATAEEEVVAVEEKDPSAEGQGIMAAGEGDMAGEQGTVAEGEVGIADIGDIMAKETHGTVGAEEANIADHGVKNVAEVTEEEDLTARQSRLSSVGDSAIDVGDD